MALYGKQSIRSKMIMNDQRVEQSSRS